eukprot:1158320-Pelagomonas_calceolata.AAC.4
MAAQHRERQGADKGGPAHQITSLHLEQHPWHMARDKGKRANTQRDAPQKKIKEIVHGKVPTNYMSHLTHLTDHQAFAAHSRCSRLSS